MGGRRKIKKECVGHKEKHEKEMNIYKKHNEEGKQKIGRTKYEAS